MGEGLFQPLHLLLLIAIALLVFGSGKFVAVGRGLGEGIRSFKDGMSGNAHTTQTVNPNPPVVAPPVVTPPPTVTEEKK